MATKSELSLNSTPLTYDKKVLSIDGISLAKLADQHATPFYVYSQTALMANFQEFLGEAQMAGLHNPLVCFAMKSNPNKELVKLLAAEGSGADIVSGGELRRALEADIPADRIVFSGVGKTEAEIEFAIQKGVFSFNVESIEELEMINQVAARLSKTARICFRLNPIVKAKTHKFISTGNKTHKFGLMSADVLKAAKNGKLWKNAKLVGLSVHIGSQLLDLKATAKAIKIMGELARKLPVTLEFLDVGGGLGIAYQAEEHKKVPAIADYMKIVAKSLHESYYSHFKTHPGTRVVFEPGRRIVAKTGVFVMKVLRQKVSDDQRFVIVDGGMNDMMRPAVYGAYHELIPVKKPVGSKKLDTHVVGPICESTDCFAHCMMPPLKSGDLLVLADAGAYGYSMGSNYNLRGRPLELLVTGENEVRIINQVQSYEELR